MSEFSVLSYSSCSTRLREAFEGVQTVVIRNLDRPSDSSGYLWRDDAQLHQSLNNIKAAAQALAMTCTKLAMLVSKSPTDEVINSLLKEFVTNVDTMMIVFVQMMDCSVSKPLFEMVSMSVRSQLVRSREFMDFVAQERQDYSVISNAAGIVFKIYDEIQALPMTNKAAYRRFAMEKMNVIKDTIREFKHYVVIARRACDPDSARGITVNDEEIDEDEDDDDEPYTMEEVDIVEPCLRMMECALVALKLALSTMTVVADNISLSPAASQDAKRQCETWVSNLYAAIKSSEDTITDLGAELYPPIANDKISTFKSDLTATLSRLATLLNSEQYTPLLSDSIRAQLAELDVTRLGLGVSDASL